MRYKSPFHPVIVAGVSLLFSTAMLLAPAGVLVTGASAQSAGESPAAKAGKTRVKQLKAFPRKLAFGNLAPLQASAPRTVTIHNPNSVDISISSIESSNPQFSLSGNCVGSMAANADCQMSVMFTPGSDGKQVGRLEIASSAGAKALSIPMTGKGKAPAGPTGASCSAPAPGACSSPGAPAILSLVPSSAVAGDRKTTVAVCGCNLGASTMVQWNGSDRRTTFVSANEVKAKISASDIAQVGVDQVTVSANSQLSAPQTFLVGTTGGKGYAELDVTEESNDIVNDPANGVIYVSVPGFAAADGNDIAVLQLSSGTIASRQFAGSEPNVLAISDDSKFLYAGIDGASSVQRFTLPSLTPDISYNLGRDNFFGPYVALDLQVAPGAPNTTAVSLGNDTVSPRAQGGIVIFDGATPRPTTAPGWNGGDALYDSIQWGTDATALYAANFESSSFDLYTLAVSLAGVVQVNDYPGLLSSYFARIHFDPGTRLIYADDGHVFDPAGNPVGQFSFQGLSIMVPDSSTGKAFFLSQSNGSALIQVFDLEHFNLIDSVTLPNVTGTPQRIIRWGNNGLAFNTDGGVVYLIGGNFVH